MAQTSCVCCRKPIRRCQGGCRAWVLGPHPLAGASAGVAGATALVAQTSGVTQATTVSDHPHICPHICPCVFQYDNQLTVSSLPPGQGEQSHITHEVSFSNHAHICSILVARFQGFLVWALQLFDILLFCENSISTKLHRPDKRHAADIGMI